MYTGEPIIEHEADYETICIEELVDSRDLIVFNDDVNTFDHVIESLIKVCKHEPEQAEQCTLLIHFKGKCSVKNGGYDTLKSMKEAIIDRGINATVEEMAY